MKIALTGFMGAGKSTLLGPLAALLHLPAFDLDTVIEQQTAKPPSDWLQQAPESCFRAQEASCLAALLQQQAAFIIALGGGSLENQACFALLQAYDVTVLCLDAAWPLLLSRLQRDHQHRPLVPKQSGLLDVFALKQRFLQRLQRYRQSHLILKISADIELPELSQKACSMLLRHQGQLKRTTKQVQQGTQSYVVVSHCQSILHLAQQLYFRLPASKKIFIVSDSHVAPLYLLPLQKSCMSYGFEVHTYCIPANEDSKSLRQLERLCQKLTSLGFDRQDAMVALGGGVVGDLTGFVASIFLRGIAYVQIPTTTLAVVDSSIGGKTAINLAFAKNRLGSFYCPQAVLIALPLLCSQPIAQHRAGLAEVVKIAAVSSAALWQRLEALEQKQIDSIDAQMVTILQHAIALKAACVTADPHEHHLRRTLNYGHTVGHAIEAAVLLKKHQQPTTALTAIPHGHAVALGMLAESSFAEAFGLSPKGLLQEIKKLLQHLQLPTNWREISIMAEAFKQDKKIQGDTLALPILEAIGLCRMQSIKRQNFEAFYTEYL